MTAFDAKNKVCRSLHQILHRAKTGDVLEKLLARTQFPLVVFFV